MKIYEGLREHDLKDLVLPVISIDEYESKVSDDGIVVGFFVKNEDSAKDLNRFIQKGSGNFLDTDISPAPDENGNYVVFVEFTRDLSFLDELFDLLKTLDRLTDVYDWDSSVYGQEESVHVNKAKLQDVIRFETKKPKDDNKDDLGEFLSSSEADDIEIHESILTFRRSTLKEEFSIEFFGKSDFIENMKMTEWRSTEVKRLQLILGEKWIVFEIDKKICIGNNSSDNILILS